MADNVPITAGTGTDIATDDVSSVHFQKVKVDAGGNGVSVPIIAGQQVAAASLPVVIASDQGALTVGSHAVTNAGTFAVQESGGVLTALQIMDDWDESDRAKVNPIVGQAGVTGGTGARGAATIRVTQATDDEAPVALAAIQSTGRTVTTAVTRPADTTAYAANDCWSDSTSAPTSGGFTLTSMGRASGGSGVITDIIIHSTNDPATLLQGELWLFDTSVTNVNDNAAFALSDTDVATLVAVIPFAMVTTVAGSGTNSYAHLAGLGIGYTCVGSANLRFLVKVKNAYTPASAEVLTFRVKCQYTT